MNTKSAPSELLAIPARKLCCRACGRAAARGSASKCSSFRHRDAQSGKSRHLTGPPHTTRHAGPHRAVHEQGAHDFSSVALEGAMRQSRKPRKRRSARKRTTRKHSSYSRVTGAAIGMLLGVVAIGPHFSEWSLMKSLVGVLISAAIGLLFGYVATTVPALLKSNSANGQSSNNFVPADSSDFHGPGGHSASHGFESSCGSDSGGHCSGGD